MPVCELHVKSVDELDRAAALLLETFKGNRFFALYGSMGAGKTTFVKAICKALKVEDDAISPTFAIVNEYVTSDNEPVFHFDFYRINILEEVYDIGYEDYFYSGSWCFIEWPELIEELLPDEYVEVKIEELEDKSRKIVACLRHL